MSYGFTWAPPENKNGNVKIGFLENNDFKDSGEMDLDKTSSLTKIGNVTKDDLCVVMIYADWCGYCKIAKPVYDEVVNEVINDLNKVKFFKINGTGEDSMSEPIRKDDEMKLKTRIKKIANDFEGFPSFYFFKGGKKVGKHSGDVTKEALINSIKINSIKTYKR